jgi:hypothetical protein
VRRHELPTRRCAVHGLMVAALRGLYFSAWRAVRPRQPELRPHPRRVMRSHAVLFAVLILAACSSGPATRSEPPAASPARALASEAQTASPDPVLQFLLTAAATDFHTHPPSAVRFRDVRMGRMITPGGEQQPLLCGEFLPAQQGGKSEWTAFATIKTSGYEQWLGAQAAGLCRSPSVLWDQGGDLSSSLQSRLDSLR